MNVYLIVDLVLTLVVWGLVIGPVLVGISLLFVYVEFSDTPAREFVSHEPDWVTELHADS